MSLNFSFRYWFKSNLKIYFQEIITIFLIKPAK